MPDAPFLAGAAVAVPFGAAALVALLHRICARDTVCGRVGLAAAIGSALLVGSLWVVAPEPAIWRVEWISGLGVGFGFWIDGLSRTFAALIAVLAVLTFLFSAAYVPASREGRGSSSTAAYYGYLLVLTGSALGFAFSADLLQLYLFWELIDIAVFLLIGLGWRERGARRSAGIVLLFTAVGGLVLLAGIVLLGTVAGGFGLPELAASGGMLVATPYFALGLVLLIAGVAIKSAQVPFHGWLPYAMRAPTPVNAFADGAAALAAGVFLLMRLAPAADGSAVWTVLLTTTGLASAVVGGLLAIRAVERKIVLAYSTVSQYGFMVALLGFGGPAAVPAAMLLMVQHGVLKAGLFFVVGSGFVTGLPRDPPLLADPTSPRRRGPSVVAGIHSDPIQTHPSSPRTRGPSVVAVLRRDPRLLVLALAAAILTLSLAGVPPLGGFWIKELVLARAVEQVPWMVVVPAVLAAALTVVYLLRLFTGTFLSPDESERVGRRLPASLVAIPGLLALATVALGIRPELIERAMAAPAPALDPGVAPDLDIHLGPALVLSVAALAAGTGAFLLRQYWHGTLQRWRLSLTAGYLAIGKGVARVGRAILGLQDGSLTRYLSLSLIGLFALAAYSSIALLVDAGLSGADQMLPEGRADPLDPRAAPLLVLIAAGSLMTLFLRSHVHMVLALGAVGYLTAAVFALAYAPSLGLLQVHVETLVTVMLILPLVSIPREVREKLFGTVRERLTMGRLAVAVGAGIATGAVSWLAIANLPPEPIAPWLIEHGQALTGASDLVAAVLLHVRALDTLGEIVVFATATAGVLAIAALMRKEAG